LEGWMNACNYPSDVSTAMHHPEYRIKMGRGQELSDVWFVLRLRLRCQVMVASLMSSIIISPNAVRMYSLLFRVALLPQKPTPPQRLLYPNPANPMVYAPHHQTSVDDDLVRPEVTFCRSPRQRGFLHLKNGIRCF
jgi:hypothetical protein